MSEIISLKNVSKSYADKVIFSDVTMSITTDKPTVIMGVNGCGKSTLLKIIAGVLSHTSGEVTRNPNIKISFAPDRFPKLPFKVSEYISHMGKINGMSDKDINNYLDTQFEYLGIPQHIKDQKIAKCSKGTIQKINIMQSLLTKTDVLVMDEPFSGLDENSIEQLVKLLTSMEQTAIVLSCHEKTLAPRISDNIFVFAGQNLVKGTDVLNHVHIKFFPKASNEPCEVLIEKDKLNEALLLLMEKGHEIHSVNPGR